MFLNFILNSDDYDDILKADGDLLSSWNDPKKGKNWEERMEASNSNWETTRQAIFEAVLGCEAAVDRQCSHCGSGQAFVRCYQCSSTNMLCVDCDLVIHNNLPFHDRSILYKGTYEPVKPTLTVDTEGNLVRIRKCYIHILRKGKMYMQVETHIMLRKEI